MSSFSAPGTFNTRQVAPPSVVRTIVPPVPLAQTTRSSTALIPRNLAAVPLISGVQGFGVAACKAVMRRISAGIRMRGEEIS
jgi:hypothetical protein